jgi:hypothetical protein
MVKSESQSSAFNWPASRLAWYAIGRSWLSCVWFEPLKGWFGTTLPLSGFFRLQVERFRRLSSCDGQLLSGGQLVMREHTRPGSALWTRLIGCCCVLTFLTLFKISLLILRQRVVAVWIEKGVVAT